MRSKNNRNGIKQSVRLLDVTIDDEVIRLTPEASSKVKDDSPLRKRDNKKVSSTKSVRTDSKPAVLFESNVFVDKLETGEESRELGRGFGSKDLTLEDLGNKGNKVASIEERWNTDNKIADHRWITKIITISLVLILFVGGWAFYNLKFNEEKNNRLVTFEKSAEKLGEEEVLDEEILQKTIEAFLQASTMEERLKWSRKPKDTLEKMKHHYTEGSEFKVYKSSKIKKILRKKLNGENVLIVSNEVTRSDELVAGKKDSVLTLLAKDENGNYLVDWSSFEVYQPSDFKSFVSSMSTKPHTFRLVIGSRVETGPYLYSFSDDREYQAYRINISGNEEDYLYAYAKVNSEQDIQLKKLFSQTADNVKRKSMLTLVYPENSMTSQCVEIVEVVSIHWFLP